MKELNFQIKEVTLLSLDEFIKYQHFIQPLGKDAWWLRSPGTTSTFVSCVDFNNTLYINGYFAHSNRCAVRPTIYILSNNTRMFQPGYKISLFDKEWTILSIENDIIYAICDTHIGRHQFDEEMNIWNNSKLKVWLEKQFKMEGNNNGKINRKIKN